MAVTHQKTVTVVPITDAYSWSMVDTATNAAPTWVTLENAQQNGQDTDTWNFIVDVNNTTNPREVTATVTHSQGPTDSFTIQQAAGQGGNPASTTTTTSAAPTPGTYTGISGGTNPIPEGSQQTITISTTGVAEGVIPTYSIVPLTTDSNGNTVSAIDSNDIVGGSLTGNMSAIDANGQSQVQVIFDSDQTSEGEEWYQFTVTGDNSGINHNGLPLTLTDRRVADTSTGNPVWLQARIQSVTPGSIPVTGSVGTNEGQSYHVFLAGESQTPGTTVYYKIVPDYSGIYGQVSGATAADFTTGITGSFSLGSGPGTWTNTGGADPNPDSQQYGSFLLTTTADGITEGREGFTIEFYSDSAMTQKITYSNGLSVEIQIMSLNDTSQSPPANFTFTDGEDPATPLTDLENQETISGSAQYVIINFDSDVAPSVADFEITDDNGDTPGWVNIPPPNASPPGLQYNANNDNGVVRLYFQALNTGVRNMTLTFNGDILDPGGMGQYDVSQNSLSIPTGPGPAPGS